MKNAIGKELVFFTHDIEHSDSQYNKKFCKITRKIMTQAGLLWEVKFKNGDTVITDTNCLYTFKVKEDTKNKAI